MSTWGGVWGNAWGSTWGAITQPPVIVPTSLSARSPGVGGGGSIDYQVPRAPRTLADSPEADAKRLAEIAALDSIYSTLTGPTSSPRMQAEAEFLAEQFEDEDGEIDFGAWADDKQARDELNAVHGRYSEARKTLFKGLRERNYDWQE